MANAYLGFGKYSKAITYYEIGLEIGTAIGCQSAIADINGNLGCAYLHVEEYESASLYLIKAIRCFDKIFLNLVPDRNKLSFTKQYFRIHRVLMSCLLSLERPRSALLVIDLGKVKELHFCIEKHKNIAELNDFSCATWNIINACEEQIEIEEIKQILHVVKNDSSILIGICV